jgi:hypothetical protein
MEAVLVALISGAFAVVGILVEKGRRENKRDHATVVDRLDLVSSEIRKDIRQVRAELSQHVNGPQHGSPKTTSKSDSIQPVRRKPKAG